MIDGALFILTLSICAYFCVPCSGVTFGADMTGMATPPNEMSGFVTGSVDMAVSLVVMLCQF